MSCALDFWMNCLHEIAVADTLCVISKIPVGYLFLLYMFHTQAVSSQQNSMLEVEIQPQN